MARKRRLKAGNLTDLQQILWATVLEVERLLDTRPPSNELVLRSAHALAQLAGAYRSVTETVSIEERLTALEEAMQHERPTHP
jgi:hypothetical protein